MICRDRCRGCIPGLSQKTKAVGNQTVHQTSPLFYCIYNREEDKEGREGWRGKIQRRRKLRGYGTGGVSGTRRGGSRGNQRQSELEKVISVPSHLTPPWCRAVMLSGGPQTPKVPTINSPTPSYSFWSGSDDRFSSQMGGANCNWTSPRGTGWMISFLHERQEQMPWVAATAADPTIQLRVWAHDCKPLRLPPPWPEKGTHKNPLNKKVSFPTVPLR